MLISEIDRQLIEKHLDKMLSESEQAVFNQRLEDPDFAHEVKQYEQAVKAVNAFGDTQLKAILQEEEAKSVEQAPEMTPQYSPDFAPKIPRKRQIGYWIALAASFLIVITVGYWLLNQNMPRTIKEKDRIFASHFKPYKNYEKPNVREEVAKTDLEKAFSLYDNGDYKQALTYFEKIATPQYLDNSALLFEANAYLATNQTEKALPILEKLSKDTTFKGQQPAEWYLALALSKTQPDKATLLFEKIKGNANHPYQKQAEAILKH